jgi:hypothetical protein
VSIWALAALNFWCYVSLYRVTKERWKMEFTVKFTPEEAAQLTKWVWPFSEIFTRIAALEASVKAMQATEATMAQNIVDLLPKITALRTQEEGLESITANLKSQVDAIVAGALSPAQQTQLDAAFSAIDQNSTEVMAAITANTQPVTPVTPVPPATTTTLAP